VPAEPATSPLFTGEVSRQPILTPEIIHVEAPGEGWSTMAELQPRTAQ
jgi:hypothetical protein